MSSVRRVALAFQAPSRSCGFSTRIAPVGPGPFATSARPDSARCRRAMSHVFELPDAVVDEIVRRAAEVVLEQLAALSQSSEPRWLYGAAAAASYLSWPTARVQKATAAKTIPHHRL